MQSPVAGTGEYSGGSSPWSPNHGNRQTRGCMKVHQRGFFETVVKPSVMARTPANSEAASVPTSPGTSSTYKDSKVSTPTRSTQRARSLGSQADSVDPSASTATLASQAQKA